GGVSTSERTMPGCSVGWGGSSAGGGPRRSWTHGTRADVVGRGPPVASVPTELGRYRHGSGSGHGRSIGPWSIPTAAPGGSVASTGSEVPRLVERPDVGPMFEKRSHGE